MSCGWAGRDKKKKLCLFFEVTEFECESVGKRKYSSFVHAEVARLKV